MAQGMCLRLGLLSDTSTLGQSSLAARLSRSPWSSKGGESRGWISVSTQPQAENSSWTTKSAGFWAATLRREKLGLTTVGTQTNNLRLFPTVLSCKPASHSSAKVPADVKKG